MIVRESSLGFSGEGHFLNTLGLRTLDFFVRSPVFLSCVSVSRACDSGCATTRNRTTTR